MKIVRISFACLSAALAFVAQAQITIDVTPSLAPNAFGSPYWNDYVSNAVTALMNNDGTYGNPALPSYYSKITGPIPIQDNIVTGFNSWLGDANPGTDFGPNFANEYGNRVHFGIHIDGHGQQFSISQLQLIGSSSDAGNGLGFEFGLGTYNYSSSYVGVIHGPSGDTFITSGPNTQLVDEVYGRGSGNAYAVYLSDPGATNQDKINNFLATLSPYSFTEQYTLFYSGGSNPLAFGEGSVQLVTPEPASLIALGIGAVSLFRRRRARR